MIDNDRVRESRDILVGVSERVLLQVARTAWPDEPEARVESRPCADCTLRSMALNLSLASIIAAIDRLGDPAQPDRLREALRLLHKGVDHSLHIGLRAANNGEPSNAIHCTHCEALSASFAMAAVASVQAAQFLSEALRTGDGPARNGSARTGRRRRSAP